MRTRDKIRNLAFALLLCLALPMAGDAGTPNQAACCNTSLPPPAPPGDEDYFSIPGGTPNVMILLDNSGSMAELPNNIVYPSTTPATGGTCSGNALNAYTANRKSVPYDNGQTSSLVVDTPPWGGYGQAGGCTGDNCLFDPTAYYRNGVWTYTSATRYGPGIAGGTGTVWPASRDGICHLTQKTGTLSPADILRNANAAAECQTCLDTVGYYLFRQAGTGTWQAVFKGDFLNGYPPKFVAARKVVKDIAFMDPAAPSPYDTVRLGLTIFTSGCTGGTSSGLRAADGGILVVPLGPSCSGAFPYNQSAYATARQAILTAVNDTSQVNWGSCTPLAETLFNIGQYYSNSGAGALYQGLFGASWMRTGFAETAAGSVNASWAGGSANRSVCWGCQQSAVIVVTDGEPNDDSNLPGYPTPASNHATFNNDFRKWTNPTIDCAACGNDLSGSPANTLHKVAYFLNQTDMRPDLTGAQAITTYTISFGIDPTTDPKAIAVLQKTADLGGGLFKNTSSGDELATALQQAVSDVVSRSTSFSSTAASSLQTAKTAQTGSYLARFRPLQGPAWEGHVFSATIFDEFGMGCDPTKTTAAQTAMGASAGSCAGKNPNLNGDSQANGNANCDGVFLVDQDCDPIIEDAQGSFHKGVFDPTTFQVISTPDMAVLAWDAGKTLSDPNQPGYKSAAQNQANSRQIWTVIDTDGDGKFTAADGFTEFKPDNVALLAPYLSLDPAWCLSMMQGIGLCGLSPLPACPTVAGWTAANTATCATQVINWVRGYDVRDLDGDHCAGPGNPSNTTDWGTCTVATDCTGASEVPAKNLCVSGKCRPQCPNGEERDRANDARTANPEFWKLGDVFHSAPALVNPPVSKVFCNLRLDPLCLQALYAGWGSAAPGTPLDPGPPTDAYDNYVSHQASRAKVVLVGADDGMLHAFYAGAATASIAPGTEVWAFIPPDLLPRLKYAMYGHQYLVDGNTMVRDVWVDQNKDGKKQESEYHTVAVITERSGGHNFIALDISNPLSPSFLWTFPQACTVESRLVGESWSSFPPRPPPIGPVKLKLPFPGGPADPLNRGWEERWIVMLNGGHDSTLVRGRGVWMLDAWTGQILWSFTNADLQTGGKNDLGHGTKASLFPVAASIGLVDVGLGNLPEGDTDGFFDTATFGDMGGNLWVARFENDPGDPANQYGVRDPSTGRVTNWFVSRAFEERRQADDSQTIAGRSPFYFMTGNTLDVDRGYLRTFAGTGNRERLLDTQQTCSADNVFGCRQAGCTVVSSSTTDDFGTCRVGQSFSCSGGVLTTGAVTATGTCTSPFGCSQNNVTATLTLDCGSGALPPITATLTCDNAGVCSQVLPFGTSKVTVPATGTTLAKGHMYGLWAWGGARVYKDLAGARSFDAARFTDVTYPAVCGVTNGGACTLVDTTYATYSTATGPGCAVGTVCVAQTLDPGWMYEYGKRCPLSSCSPSPPWTDEKTATSSVPTWGVPCVTWSTTRPTGGSAGSDPCTSSVGAPTAYGYIVDVLSGAPTQSCGYSVSGTTYQASVRNSPAPPQDPMTRVVVTAGGQIKYTSLHMDAGSQPQSTTLGYRESLSDLLYYLEVPRELHTCRHVNPSTCK